MKFPFSPIAMASSLLMNRGSWTRRFTSMSAATDMSLRKMVSAIAAKHCASLPARKPGKGPTWITTLVPLGDERGREKLFASYVKVEPPLKITGRGLAVFQDDKEEFQHLAQVDLKAPTFPMGHALRHRDQGVDFV